MEIKCSVFTQNLRVFWISTADFFVYGKCGYYTDLFGGKYRIFTQKIVYQRKFYFHMYKLCLPSIAKDRAYP